MDVFHEDANDNCDLTIQAAASCNAVVCGWGTQIMEALLQHFTNSLKQCADLWNICKNKILQELYYSTVTLNEHTSIDKNK